jgi:hypothetical protein
VEDTCYERRRGPRTREGTRYFNTRSRPVFPGSSRLGIEPKTPGWLVQAESQAQRGSGALLGLLVCVYYLLIRSMCCVYVSIMCVFITAGPSTKLFT